ncbi:MAG: phosphoribosylformylglycinamidine synthase subunit PurL, partial [Bacteroidia bacterium]|nr:phosphoribosylformylglycinamidine synthase subunit PurL [Bacteroidia bacterium]
FGVPTVGGEVYFEECYHVNILVNAMSAGIVETDKTISAISYGAGNPVFIVGADTGKDGIHGATFASGDLTEDSENDLPSVQVGDPFQEKLLLEATLELAETDAIIGMQDMGAAGIICSTSEMSAKGKSGMIIHLDKVPTRQENMKSWEILLSESQERMLVVVKKGREEEVNKIFEKWDIHCEQIGEVIDDDKLYFHMNGELIAEVPADDLVLGGGAPVYDREYTEPAYIAKTKSFDITTIDVPEDLEKVALKLLTHHNIASKRWVYQQYDSMVGTKNMITNKPSDAAVVNIKESDKAIVLTVDCNARYVYSDPKQGASIAVAEAARNITCSGGNPSAITNCLNFGNPYNPEVYWQFVNAIQGMGDACKKFNTPVTGGNVSFYNQSMIEGKEVPVYPTPTIGMLGLLEDKSKIMTLDFKNDGDVIYLIGTSRDDINSSEYLHSVQGVKHSPAPYLDLDEELRVQNTIRELINSNLIQSAHDVSDGGLFITLSECAMPNELGFEVQSDGKIRKDAFWFGESQSRVVVSMKKKDEESFINELKKSNVAYTKLGMVTKGFNWKFDEFEIQDASSAKIAYLGSIESHL